MRRCVVFLFSLLCASQLWAVRVAVVLPLKDKSALGQTAVEFYRGLLLAVDSVKRGGLSVEIYTVDSGVTDASLLSALNAGGLPDVDVVFGPGVSSQTEVLASYCKQRGTRLVMPFATPYGQVGENPMVTQVTPPLETLYPDVVQLVIENLADDKFVMLKCDDGTPEDAAFQSALAQRIEGYGLPYGTLNLNADEIAAQMAFSGNGDNVIVPDSHSEASLSAMLSLLKQFRAKYPGYSFSILGYPSWLALASKYQDDLFAFDTYVFSPFYYNPVNPRVLGFGKAYNENFGSPLPLEVPSPVMLGFDVGYYVLNGVNPMPLQQDFLFRQVGDQGGQANAFVQLVHFSTGKAVTNIR